jgi:hypothetical protein
VLDNIDVNSVLVGRGPSQNGQNGWPRKSRARVRSARPAAPTA